jgi:hypothetical protein
VERHPSLHPRQAVPAKRITAFIWKHHKILYMKILNTAISGMPCSGFSDMLRTPPPVCNPVNIRSVGARKGEWKIEVFLVARSHRISCPRRAIFSSATNRNQGIIRMFCTHTPPPFGCISGARTPIDQTIRDPNLKNGLNERAGENLQSSN